VDRSWPAELSSRGSIALNPRNRIDCCRPTAVRMASLTETRIVRIFFPQPLPMHEHIDVVPFDHNAFDREVQRDGTKRLEIALSLFPQPVKWSTGIMSEARSDESSLT